MNLSVVIPTFNYAAYLRRAVESVLPQLCDGDEVIVVDDGSTDDTAALMAVYPPPVHYLHQPNAGPGAARNRGVAAARNDYLLFLDADDRLLPGALAALRERFSAHPEADMVCGGYVSVSERGRERTHDAPGLTDGNLANFAAYIEGRFGIANGAAAYHRRVFERLRFATDIRNREDTVLEGQVLALYKCVAVTRPLAAVHAHPGRQRDNVNTIDDYGDTAVDLLFNPELLPAPFMALRERFACRHLLERARANYRVRRHRRALALYREALRRCPALALKPTHLRKFVRAWLRSAAADRD